MPKHWTEQMFLERGDLYIPFLEALLPQAPAEAQAIQKVLTEQNVLPDSHILDLSCGIGRHSVELACLGYRVTGIDLAPAHIKRAQALAKEKSVAKQITFKVADARSVARELTGAQFDAVINIFTSFGFYNDETNTNILKQCRQLARKDAIFVMDIMNRDWVARHFQTRGFSHAGDLILLEERELDQLTGRMRNRWTFLREKPNGDYQHEATTELDHRIYNLHELIQLFSKAGWSFVTAFGGLDLSKLEVASRRLLVICRAA
jgi:SAM-dependent methyltransferase